MRAIVRTIHGSTTASGRRSATNPSESPTPGSPAGPSEEQATRRSPRTDPLAELSEFQRAMLIGRAAREYCDGGRLVSAIPVRLERVPCDFDRTRPYDSGRGLRERQPYHSGRCSFTVRPNNESIRGQTILEIALPSISSAVVNALELICR